MIDIFAHRAICDSQENTIEGIKNCVKLGIGIELDLRNSRSGIYMAHDPVGSGDLFDEACKILKNSNSKVALHIKEIDAVKEIVEIINKYSINDKCFIFTDSNNHDTTINLVHQNVEVAFYASQKPSNVHAKVLWCDELKNRWYKKDIINDLHKNHKVVYAMSKELLETCNKKEIVTEWKRLLELQFDGICTNHPKELYQFERHLK